MEEYKVNLLKLIAKYDLHTDLFWHEDLRFFVNCSDVFAWAYADLEEIESQEDVDALEQAILDCIKADGYGGQYDGSILFVARKRKMRPQGAMYESLCPACYSLFDACGPLREVGLGNPKKHPSENE